MLPCDTVFSMETSDKVTDKCSSQFCHQLPFQIHEAREAAGGTLPQPAPLASAASGLRAGGLAGTGISPLPLCSPAHSEGEETSLLPAVPCVGTLSVPGNSLVFVGILVCLSIRLLATFPAVGSGRSLPVPWLPGGNPFTGISQVRR